MKPETQLALLLALVVAAAVGFLVKYVDGGLNGAMSAVTLLGVVYLVATSVLRSKQS